MQTAAVDPLQSPLRSFLTEGSRAIFLLPEAQALRLLVSQTQRLMRTLLHLVLCYRAPFSLRPRQFADQRRRLEKLYGEVELVEVYRSYFPLFAGGVRV